MKFYELPSTLTDDLSKFENEIKEFRLGNIHPTQFKGIRVAHGVYEQRKEDTYMVRIRVPGGQMTPTQLKKVSEISKQYGAKEFHVTTRMEMQFHYIKLEDVPAVYRGLMSVGLSPRGGGGNTVRNIMASHNSGIAADEVFDVAPYASELTTRMIDEADSWNLPRKFKIAFSNSPADNAAATITCLGFIAKIKDGKEGFKVYVGGGMGSKPILGQVLYEWCAADRVYYITSAIKSLFDRIGDRRHKYQSRLKFLVTKLGLEEIRRLVEEEMDKLEPGLELNIAKRDNIAKKPNIEIIKGEGKDYEAWITRYVSDQKQAGLKTILVPLFLGDIENQDGIELADFLNQFGEDTLRACLDQNIYLRNIPEEYLGNVYAKLNSLHTLSTKPVILSNMIACTGADTCKLGICLPRGVTPPIAEALEKSNLDLDALADVKIHISGCPNTCGRHHVADLGFFGKVMRKDGSTLPAYNILVGAAINDEDRRFAQKVDEVPSKHMPEFVVDVMTDYLENKDSSQSFSDYIYKNGKEVIPPLADKYRQVPSLSENESYYHDWGAEEQFSLLKGQRAECCAGVFDMIDVDQKAAKAQLKLSQESEGDAADKAINRALFHAARMLLVTRGIEAHNKDKVYTSFAQHFIEAGLVGQEHKALIEKAKEAPLTASDFTAVEALINVVISLYKDMDDSLRFKTTPVCEVPAKDDNTPSFEDNTDATPEITVKQDFRGVGCPMNFVKTKIALSPMKSGEVLEILLDDGEPIQNVPGSVKLEGHLVLDQSQKDDGHWSVIIQKS
ncbi:MAG: sulfurtransferase TusA family protein [Planctomycetes bacterium]|nr:sulfurtransferase TusA family protein [Planctomycetota bacterium]